MSTDCFKCNNKLVSATELSAKACLKCFQDIVKELHECKLQLSVMTEENAELKKFKVDAQETAERRSMLINAESNGMEAGSRGALRNDNPYGDDSEEATFWEAGWYREWLPNELQRMKSIMAWSLDVLAPARELAKGYGRDDISSCIDQVIIKVGPYLEELFEDEKE